MKIVFNNNKKGFMNPLRFMIMTVIFHLLIDFVISKRFLAQDEQKFDFNSGNSEFKILSHGGHQVPVGSPEFYKAIIIAAICVISAGFCSGMTIGYLSIKELDLQILLNGEDEEQKKLAKNILPIIQQHHLLLSTLLVANALAMESLPIYLHEIFPAVYAVLFSTVFLVIFGEILPQAYCIGPDQLKIANAAIPLIKILIFVFWIICYPTAKLLDFVLGINHKFLFTKSDLMGFFQIHTKYNIYSQDQFKLIQSLFDLRTDSVEKQMVPYSKVFCIDQNEVISKDLINKVKSFGYSQIPVISGDKQNVSYIMKTKHFLLCQQSQIGKTIKKRFYTKEPLVVKKNSSMLDLLMVFQQTQQTFALIADEIDIKSHNQKKDEYISGIQSQRNQSKDGMGESKIIGIITLKDVFEEILDQQLLDEDLHKGQKIELENLKQRKKEIKQQIEQMQQEKQKDGKLDTEEVDEAADQFYSIDNENDKMQEYQKIKKQIKAEKRRMEKQQRLINNHALKQEKKLGMENELVSINSRNQGGQGLNEPLIERKKSF
ncbi:hypothetical protein PPERSA_08734 [Pseudocohnilembus persalinus]|uniref:CNNM transmembrane domain-containing protein n=1 Tax=Pseudocohnilembus persalinus TaxID=266149 RepID=A0A0V0QY13_PSEPJ|nr:hypothetical protein PPERSA_08734 [Pseudocohnilembus persalinus]|eukprot:KRX07057.1 hypothetical protein PPERSA_08734 [Pseudocohnilembus persalinus]